MRYTLAVLAYLVPTFFLGFVWHLVLFDGYYHALLSYGAVGALLSWSFTTPAVAAKNVMASVPDYLLIETAFTLVEWVIVAPLTALAWSWRRRRPQDTQPV
jgi:hypothetical protein